MAAVDQGSQGEQSRTRREVGTGRIRKSEVERRENDIIDSPVIGGGLSFPAVVQVRVM